MGQFLPNYVGLASGPIQPPCAVGRLFNVFYGRHTDGEKVIGLDFQTKVIDSALYTLQHSQG